MVEVYGGLGQDPAAASVKSWEGKSGGKDDGSRNQYKKDIAGIVYLAKGN